LALILGPQVSLEVIVTQPKVSEKKNFLISDTFKIIS